MYDLHSSVNHKKVQLSLKLHGRLYYLAKVFNSDCNIDFFLNHENIRGTKRSWPCQRILSMLWEARPNLESKRVVLSYCKANFFENCNVMTRLTSFLSPFYSSYVWLLCVMHLSCSWRMTHWGLKLWRSFQTSRNEEDSLNGFLWSSRPRCSSWSRPRTDAPVFSTSLSWRNSPSPVALHLGQSLF